MPEMISELETAFIDQALGKATPFARSTITLAREGGWVGIMPAYLPSLNSFTTKIVTLYNGNLDKGLPAIIGTIILNDPSTGQVLSIMDGAAITAMRTGGLGGLAAKYLSRTDSQVAGIFGAGVQARTQLKGLVEVRQINRALVYDTAKERAENYAHEMSTALKIPVEVAESPSSIVRTSDIITTVTPSKKPLFDGSEIKPGTHLSAFGNYTPTEREIDSQTVVRSKVYVDLQEAALEEAGDLIIPIKEGLFTKDKIIGNIGQVILGSVLGRQSKEEITLFKSVGLGIQDCAAASLAYRNAIRNKVGTDIDL